MADSSSLRRSSRRAKKRNYRVGDSVEILSENNSDSIIATGRLISQSTTGSKSASTTPRWLVGFEDESIPPEEFSESRLGEILGKKSPSPNTVVTSTIVHTRNSTSATTQKVAGGRTKKTRSSPLNPEKEDPGSSSESLPSLAGSTRSKGKTSKKKRIVFDDSDAVSASSRSKRALAASAREERSKRRQAQQPPTSSSAPIPRPAKKANTQKQKEKAIRVPMLTGTLFLYRGKTRRAEFVRKV